MGVGGVPALELIAIDNNRQNRLHRISVCSESKYYSVPYVVKFIYGQ